MALKLLQPGLRPMGQFDLDDDISDKENITGGELMSVEDQAGTEKAVSDVNDIYPAQAVFAADCVDNSRAATAFVHGFLADEGIKGYGTLFGELIGGVAGQATSQSGAVTIGPATHVGTDKVTLHHQPGLYGITAPSANKTTGVGGSSDAWASGSITQTIGNRLSTDGAGKWGNATATGDQYHCIQMGPVNDDSLVSTTTAAATGSGAISFYAVYFLGPVGAIKRD